MGLKLNNEFVVAAPLERTWETLLDIRRVAGCMPGATIEPGGEDGLHRGQMKVKIGPMNVAYAGTVRMADVDDDDHVSTLDVKAKEQRGQGTARATITNRLSPDANRTRVLVETDLAITGRAAQFGRGIMEDVASKMLADFAQRLEREVLSEPAAATGEASPSTTGAESVPVAAVAASPPAPSDAGDDVLDIGGVITGPLAQRVGVAAGGILILSGVLWTLTRLLRRRKGIELNLRYR